MPKINDMVHITAVGYHGEVKLQLLAAPSQSQIPTEENKKPAINNTFVSNHLPDCLIQYRQQICMSERFGIPFQG